MHKITWSVPALQEDEIAEQLLAEGLTAVITPNDTPESETVDISIFLGGEEFSLKRSWLLSLFYVEPRFELAADDWLNQWCQDIEDLEPVQIADEFIIIPISSETDRPQRQTAARFGECSPIFIDPRDTFGYGSHPTTRIALEELLRWRALIKGHSALDFGSGSGVLALLAAKLGAHSVYAVENDIQSRQAGQRNAMLNGLSSIQFTDALSLNPLKERTNFDVILANVPSEVQRANFLALRACAAPNALVVATGFLATEIDDMLCGFGIREVLTTPVLGEWGGIVGRL